jgi:hypothetical protein
MCFEGVDRTILPGLLEQVEDRGKNSFAVSTVATVARAWIPAVWRRQLRQIGP